MSTGVPTDTNKVIFTGEPPARGPWPSRAFHRPPPATPTPRLPQHASTLIPAGESRLTLNGVQATGKAYPSTRPDGTPFSSSFLAFSESWTELRPKL